MPLHDDPSYPKTSIDGRLAQGGLADQAGPPLTGRLYLRAFDEAGAEHRLILDPRYYGLFLEVDGDAYILAEATVAPRFIPSAGSGPQLPALPQEADALIPRDLLWSHVQAAATAIDPRIVLGICYQESSFRNWRVHMDGTGAGLFGLDDGGLLPDFERWSGLQCGRGQNHIVIPPELQIRYACEQLGRYATQFGGDSYAAARAWHRGVGLMNDAHGQQYEALIRAHVQELFG